MGRLHEHYLCHVSAERYMPVHYKILYPYPGQILESLERAMETEDDKRYSSPVAPESSENGQLM